MFCLNEADTLIDRWDVFLVNTQKRLLEEPMFTTGNETEAFFEPGIKISGILFLSI